jgi:hypothetical protein
MHFASQPRQTFTMTSGLLSNRTWGNHASLEPEVHPHLSAAWLIAVTLILATIVAYFAQPYVRDHWGQKPPFVVKATDTGGRMRTSWDPRLSVVREADSGILEVRDGREFNRFTVEARVLRAGHLDYLRKSKDVELTLTLLKKGKPASMGVVRSIGY